MGSGNDSILDMYLYETNTLLEQLDGILLAAEQADTFSQDSVNEIFRIMWPTGSRTCSLLSGKRPST